MNSKLNVFTFIIVILFAAVANGQIERHFEYDPSNGNDNYSGRKYLAGTFDFENIPLPLQKARVKFTLRIIGPDVPEPNNDWSIGLHYSKRLAKVLSDTLFNWPGPHKKGDSLTGYLDFIPLLSGKHYIVFCLIREVIIKYNRSCTEWKTECDVMGGVYFYWCINKDGILEDLGIRGDGVCRDPETRVVFFDKDFVNMYHFFYPGPGKILEYDAAIRPIPQIGDTSYLYFDITALEDIFSWGGFYIKATNIEILNISDTINIPLLKGEHFKIKIGFIPLEAKKGQEIIITSSRGVHFDCNFVFNDDRTLRYVCTDGFNNFPDDKFPQNFPSLDYWVIKEIPIIGDSLIIKK